jgi:hypothetical protein
MVGSTKTTRKRLSPLVRDFDQQIQALSDIILKMRPKVDSNAARNLKAVTSFRYDSEVKHIEAVMRGYVATLTLESAITSNSKGPVGMTALSYLLMCDVLVRSVTDLHDRIQTTTSSKSGRPIPSRSALCEPHSPR